MSRHQTPSAVNAHTVNIWQWNGAAIDLPQPMRAWMRQGASGLCSKSSWAMPVAILDMGQAAPHGPGDHVCIPQEIDMIQNVGTIDRAMRVLAGLALIAASAFGHIGWWGWIGVVPLLTGLFGVCPAYRVFGLSTCRC
jgi:hypothetical protein